MENEQDGIEERAAKHLRDNNLVWNVEGNLPRIVADLARAETATLTTQLNEMREALRELCESSKDHSGDQYFRESLAKARKLLDAQ